jgi:two-component system, OmpR family, alkaline phosphatase synthesis response regulator PhoP
MPPKILIVDDEADIVEFVSYNLRKEGYTVFTAQNGKAAIDIAEAETPDLILLDVMMPEMDGIEVCNALRKRPKLAHTIIAFLTARHEDYAQIAGFEAGGDDYISKPIRPRVLVSRIQALLRRQTVTAATESESNTLTFDNISIDRERVMVVIAGQNIILARKEFELLWLLATKPGKVFTRDEIYIKIWGSEVIVGTRTIDVHIRKIREKLGGDYIKTIKGIGYKFE